jgi:non-heme chloroperoxidase
MSRLDVENGKQIYFEDYAGPKRPVVLIHGWGMSVRVWDYNLPALQDSGHRIVGLDHRGCGSSDKDFDDVSIAAIAADVVRLVRERGLEKPVLVGWSLGAAVAVEAAAALGDDAGGLVLVGSTSPRFSQTDDWDIGADEEAATQTAIGLRTDRANFLYGLSQAVCKEDPGEPVVDWMWSIFMQTSANADQTLAALAEVEHRKLLPTLNLPVLLCSGPDDQIVDHQTSVRADELLPNSRLVNFEKSGHAPFLEESERFDDELASFLDELA